MGQEARCLAHVGGRVLEVKVLLESDELILRGEHRARLPFSHLDSVEAADGRLTVRRNGEAIVLELGAAAERWAAKIRNPPSLLDKLGVKAGQRVAAVGLTDRALLAQLRARVALEERPAVVDGAAVVESLGGGLDLVFVEVSAAADLAWLRLLHGKIAQDGAIWVVHLKGRADLKDVDVIAAGRAAGLVDTKVARVSERHSALRFVIPKASRR